MDSFDQELKTIFLEEMLQLLGDAEQCFLALEANPQDTATLEKIFRIAHNIKGGVKAIGFNALSTFTHEFETFMLKCKSGQIPILPATISLFLKCNDHIKKGIDRLKEDSSAVIDSEGLIAEINQFSVADQPPPAESPTSANPIPADEPALQEQPSPEESPPPNPENKTAADPATASTVMPATVPTTASTQTLDESIRVSLSRLEKLLDFVGELVILQTVLKEQAYGDNLLLMRKTIHQMGKITKEVQDLSMSLRMVPLKQTFQKMQRIVRDTASLLEKKVQLQLQGEETEVDKTVLEALSDPLIHLIRNAVDHGIESPTDRAAQGKPEMGQVLLKAYHESGKLVIEVKDNGGGISPEKLRQKAIEKGILKPGQTLSDEQAIQLIFHPGFSTKSQVTEVSGRGVGMDVVKTNIEQIHGEVLVDTQLNEGSTFKIILPLTLAIIDGMVVTCGPDRYVIPLAHVHESVKTEANDIQVSNGLGEVLVLRGENLPIIRLSQALGKRKNPKNTFSEKIAIIIRTQSKPFATLVDDIVGQYQVVIKKLGAEMQNLRGYSGSAILGDGRPVLILELGDLVTSSSEGSSFSQKRQVAA